MSFLVKNRKKIMKTIWITVIITIVVIVVAVVVAIIKYGPTVVEFAAKFDFSAQQTVAISYHFNLLPLFILRKLYLFLLWNNASDDCAKDG